MDFRFTEYQTTVESAVSALTSSYSAPPAHADSPFIYSQALDEEIERSGFHDVTFDPDLGWVTAALVVNEIAKLPVCVEIMASTLIRPGFCHELPRPVALVDRPDRPVRFLPQAKTAIVLQDDVEQASIIALLPGDVESVESSFAYPYGRLSQEALNKAELMQGSASEVRRLWQVGLVAEISGAMQSALALTTDYVTQREQFGRPLGTFQAIQHRLSEVAVQASAVKWLGYRAASGASSEDAALACAYAQDAARRAAFELHQLTGAIGLTFEYALHFWTYRLKALLSELGGSAVQSLELAQLVWGAPSGAHG